jgi:hypothetical protein
VAARATGLAAPDSRAAAALREQHLMTPRVRRHHVAPRVRSAAAARGQTPRAPRRTPAPARHSRYDRTPYTRRDVRSAPASQPTAPRLKSRLVCGPGFRPHRPRL